MSEAPSLGQPPCRKVELVPPPHGAEQLLQGAQSEVTQSTGHAVPVLRGLCVRRGEMANMRGGETYHCWVSETASHGVPPLAWTQSTVRSGQRTERARHDSPSSRRWCGCASARRRRSCTHAFSMKLCETCACRGVRRSPRRARGPVTECAHVAVDRAANRVARGGFSKWAIAGAAVDGLKCDRACTGLDSAGAGRGERHTHI